MEEEMETISASSSASSLTSWSRSDANRLCLLRLVRVGREVTVVAVVVLVAGKVDVSEGLAVDAVLWVVVEKEVGGANSERQDPRLDIFMVV